MSLSVISTSPPKGIFDYTPKMLNGVIASLPADQVQTVLSVTGKGLLYKVAFYNGGANNRVMKVTIDGTVVHWYQSSSNSAQSLLVNTEYITPLGGYTFGGNGASQFVPLGTKTVSFPNNTLQIMSGSLVILNQPIKFNSSLLVETYYVGSSGSNLIYGISYALEG